MFGGEDLNGKHLSKTHAFGWATGLKALIHMG